MARIELFAGERVSGLLAGRASTLIMAAGHQCGLDLLGHFMA